MKLSELRSRLAIDTDDLDQCLVQQPDLYYHVAEAYVGACSLRDEAKLDLEETTAEIDRQIRAQALEKQERLTEEAAKQQVRLAPKVKDLTRKYFELRADADVWQALKEAYQQRSYMLRELVAKQISEMQSLGIERSARAGRTGVVEVNRARINAARRERAT